MSKWQIASFIEYVDVLKLLESFEDYDHTESICHDGKYYRVFYKLEEKIKP